MDSSSSRQRAALTRWLAGCDRAFKVGGDSGYISTQQGTPECPGGGTVAFGTPVAIIHGTHVLARGFCRV